MEINPELDVVTFIHLTKSDRINWLFDSFKYDDDQPITFFSNEEERTRDIEDSNPFNTEEDEWEILNESFKF